ncbi:transmembrane amino acid transporter protein-domain-containing protein [Phascolomyces articulosus]|uniref:Transmembrane amino acid transporter protein-domain-containing protein n=1 Tax=Phascolomyces articulosus TaxID=60185 RepID=A0AAD5KLW2_9FUNG|nr:transmembrane amino acid transporter protein-domain-containing protein [Phascolomyces articulosus]
MNIPNSKSPSMLMEDDQDDRTQITRTRGGGYGTSYQDPNILGGSSSSPRGGTSRSFSEQIEGLVGSYTRTSLAYMAENIPINSTSPSNTAVDNKDYLQLPQDEEQHHVDKASIHSGVYYPSNTYTFPGADADCRSYYSQLGMEADERSSLLSYTESSPVTGGYIETVLTRTTSKADSTLNEYPTRKHVPKSSFLQSVFNSTNILLGIGILAMPLGFKIAGWVIGVLVFIFCFGVTNYTAKILAECLDAKHGSQTYGDIGAAAFGTKGRIMVSAIFITELIAVSVALVVFMSDEINALFPGLNPILLNVVSFFVLTPMLFVPVRHLSYASLLGIVIALHILFILFFDGLSKPDAPGSLIEPAETDLLPPNWSALPLSFGLIMAGFAGHSVFPTIYRDMENPRDYKAVVDWTYVATAIVYFFIAAAGYRMFGRDTLEEITQNLISIPEYNRAVNLFVLWLLALNPVAKYGLSLSPVNLTWQIALLRNPNVETWCQGSIWRVRFLTITGTVLLSAMIVFIAYIFPAFDKVMGLLGSLFAFIISAVFPLSCHLKLFRNTMSTSRKMVTYMLLGVSITMGVFGTWKSFF